MNTNRTWRTCAWRTLLAVCLVLAAAAALGATRTLARYGSPPSAPTGLSATPGNAEVALSWNASSGATSYSVYDSTTSGGPYTQVATGLTNRTYTVTGLTSGTTYYFVVTASNSWGTSGNSSQVSAIVLGLGGGLALDIAAIGGNGSVSIEWGASYGATSYTVLRSTTSGSGFQAIQTGLTQTFFIDNSVTNGTTYYYEVAAYYPPPPFPQGPALSSQVSATPSNTYTMSNISDLQEYASEAVGTSGGIVSEHTVLAAIPLLAAPQNTSSDSYMITYQFTCSSNTVVYGTNETNSNGSVSFEGQPGTSLYLGLGAANVLNGGTISITETITLQDLHKNADSTQTNVQTTINVTHTFEFDKLIPNASSIDSRKVFGQPDIAGEEPGDANAPQMNANFNGWIYNGGMFVGNILSGSGDLSGTARVQVYLPSQSLNGTTVYNTLTLLDNGIPSIASGSMNVIAWLPSPTDPNIGSTAANVTWATAWVPQSAIKTIALSSSSVNTYLNYQLGTSLVSLVGLSLDNESGYSSSVWHYFGSPAYSPPPNAVFPQTDCAPRIWRVGQTS